MQYRNNYLKIKNKKNFTTVLLAIIAVTIGAILTGCGNSEKKVNEKDLLEIVQALKESEAFSASLIEVNENTVINYYGLDEETVSVAAAYMGDGTSAEEVVLLKCKDTSKVAKTVKNYLSDKYDTYASYLPEEAEKIDNAIIKKYKGYILVCVAGDRKKAASIING